MLTSLITQINFNQPSYYITLETIYSDLSRLQSNFKDHYSNAAREQCLGMIAEVNGFSF